MVESQVTFSKSGNDLVLTIASDPITIQNYFLGDQYKISSIQFADGASLTSSQIDAMVTTSLAQATLNAPPVINFGNIHVGATASEAVS